MGELLQYVGEFWTGFWPLFSAGAVYGLDEVLTSRWPAGKAWLERRASQANRRRVEYVLVLLATFYAGFTVYQGEHAKRLTAEQKVASPISQSTFDRMNADLLEARGKIDSQAATIAAQQGQIDQQKKQLGTLQDWHLTGPERENFARALEAFPLAERFTIEAHALIGSNQSQMYLNDFATVIDQHGWKVSGGSDTGIRPDLVGLHIIVKAGTREPADLPKEAVAFANVLKAANIRFSFASGPAAGAGFLLLYVGTKWSD